MSAPRTVAVLFHERETRAKKIGYKVWTLGEIWARRGIEIVPVFGLDTPVETDTWINHLDLTKVPDRYAAFLQAQPRVVNRAMLDISKRTISSNLVPRADDPYDGPVIVKSDLNHGGVPERRAFKRSKHSDDPRPPARFRIRGPTILRTVERKGRVSPREYQIYDRPADVPSAIYENEQLVVERFLPERDGPHYCGQSYLFFGDHHFCVRKWSTAPIIRTGVVVRVEVVEPHPGIVAIKDRFGFDYGKLDYVVRDDEVVLFDASRTPTFALPDEPLGERDLAMVAALEGGIDAFLP